MEWWKCVQLWHFLYEPFFVHLRLEGRKCTWLLFWWVKMADWLWQSCWPLRSSCEFNSCRYVSERRFAYSTNKLEFRLSRNFVRSVCRCSVCKWIRFFSSSIKWCKLMNSVPSLPATHKFTPTPCWQSLWERPLCVCNHANVLHMELFFFNFIYYAVFQWKLDIIVVWVDMNYGEVATSLTFEFVC
jgi:hypothetical protein